MSSRKKRQCNSTRKHHTERDRSSTRRRTSISRLFKNIERGGTAPTRKQFDSLPNKYREESRHRHVKAIFGQASQVTDETPRATLSVVDTNRITEKAEALRRTYRSNLRPTLDSGYSTMATRSGDAQGVTRRRRRRRRSSSSSSMDYNSSTSSIEDGEGVISTTDTDTDTADEEDKEKILFTQKEQQRVSSTSTASSSTRPESLGGCQQHDMMQDDHLFLCVSSENEPYPRSSLSTPCYAESRRPLHTPSPPPDHHHHLESKSSDDLKEENNRSAYPKESSMIAMKQDKDNTTTYFVSYSCSISL